MQLSKVVIALALLAALFGCSSSERSSPPAPSAFIGITASKSVVVADGVNSVTLTVTDTGGGPVAVSTNKGTFSTGGNSTTVSGASATVTLVSCSSSSAGCIGAATVTATSGTGTATTSVMFDTLVATCATECSADAACPTQSCNLAGGGAGVCSATSPSACLAVPCTPSAATETSCTDGTDNDCSGDADGDDATCEGRSCQAGSPTLIWKSGACTDMALGLGIKVTPARTRLPANGTEKTSVVVEVTSGEDPLPATSVTISANLGSLSTTTAATDADGKATFTFTSSATTGVATLTAYVNAVPTVAHSATITMPKLGAFQLAAKPVQYPVMGVKGSGWNEIGWIQVQVVDDHGEPYPDGLAVTFTHQSLGGSSFGDPGVVTTTVKTSSGDDPADTDGLATVWIHSGNLAGTLAVNATATVAGVSASADDLPTVTVVGAKASGANLSIVCSPRNLPALAATDCAISLVDAPFTCQAMLKDRFNNVLGRETQVIFASEATTVGQVVWTPEHDGGAGPQTDLGIAVQGFNTLGAGLPFDVDAITSVGEPGVLHGLDGCGLRQHNPRDGVVTIIAIADGEEAFFDANGSGVYDAGEPFVDQGEPFVDQDDNGQWDPGEWFLDVDGDAGYTPPNGQWDDAKKIWTQTVVVYTGEAATLASGGQLLGTRFAGAGFANACTPTPPPAPFDVDAATSVAPATSETYSLVASDMNMNFLNTGTKYGVSVVPDDAPIELEYHGLDQYTDLPGFFYRYWPCDQNGNCASQCRATGGNAPCLMTPSISNYSCGLTTSVQIIGGDEPGSGKVEWNVDVPYTVFDAVERVSHGRAELSGIVR